MKKDYAGSVSAQKALALAVSCWLLCGGLAQAKDVYGQGDASNTGDISGVNWTLNEDVADTDYSNTFNLAYTQKGTASNNKLVINGGTYSVSSSDSKSYANWFNGGISDNGAAKDNSIIINDCNLVNPTKTNQAAGIYAGFAKNGYDATNNSVTINGGSFAGYTYAAAAVAASGNADNNTITVNGGNFESGAYLFGGRANTTGNANGNTVNVTSGTIGAYRAFAWGGKADNGNAEGNTVNISGGTIADSANPIPPDDPFDKKTYADYVQGAAEIYGGYTLNGTAADNIVNISGGTIASNGECVVYGGYSQVGNAVGNIINISGGTAQQRLTAFGGFASNGNATGNTIIVTGGNASGLVYLDGGVTMSSTGNATGNTVAIYAPVPLTVAAGGAYFTGSSSSSWSKTNNGDLKTGNTLLLASYGISAQNIYNFETLAFQLPAAASTSTMLTLTDGSDGDLADTKIALTADQNASLSTGQTIQLVSSNSALNYNGATTGTLHQGTALQYDYTLNNSTNSLSATLGQQSVNSETKSLVETREAQSAFLNRGADLLITQGFEQADMAAQTDKRNWSPFFASQAGNNRYNTGSHVENSGWSSILGMSKAYGSWLAGVAVEYGNGDYDSYMSSMHGKGDTKYTGVALFARKAAVRGLYYEGSIRGGQSKADYTSSDFTGYKGTAVHYNTDSNYWGAHLGIGKVIPVSRTDDLDVSLRYLYSHSGSDNVQLSTGENYAFDAVNSHRLRTGLRWTRRFNDANAMYAGMAYQYEFNGDARASYKGFGLASPSLKGSSGMLELGYRVKPSEDLPLTIDFNVTGWTGVQRGVTGQVGFTYNF